MKKEYIIPILILAVPIGGLLAWINLRYRMNFDPALLTNELFKFFAGVVSIGISFWLANVYWANKTKQDRVLRARKIISRFFYQLRDILAQCENLLFKEYLPEELQESHDRDTRVIGLFSSMKIAKEALLIHYPDMEVEQDDQLTEIMVDLFWASIVPAINNLSTRQTVRGDKSEIERQLGMLKKSIEQALKFLGSERYMGQHFDGRSRDSWQS